jgi:hypothetical protein
MAPLASEKLCEGDAFFVAEVLQPKYKLPIKTAIIIVTIIFLIP